MTRDIRSATIAMLFFNYLDGYPWTPGKKTWDS